MKRFIFLLGVVSFLVGCASFEEMNIISMNMFAGVGDFGGELEYERIVAEEVLGVGKLGVAADVGFELSQSEGWGIFLKPDVSMRWYPYAEGLFGGFYTELSLGGAFSDSKNLFVAAPGLGLKIRGGRYYWLGMMFGASYDFYIGDHPTGDVQLGDYCATNPKFTFGVLFMF
jgi:hypothetical protein